MLMYGPPMTAVYNFSTQRIISLGRLLSLILSILFFTKGCRQKTGEEITIVWHHKKAAGVAIPTFFFNGRPKDSVLNHLEVRLENSTVAMLGAYKLIDDQFVFTPLISLLPGTSYDVLFQSKVISKLKIPSTPSAVLPYLVAVYPTEDTLPENLLKLYLQFSAPMREGDALQHITLLNEHNDTVQNVFLNLDLWNTERTTLTVWLDPGRIKRDLIPNRRMGKPLEKGRPYTLSVSGEWKDIQGSSLRQSYSKKFMVGARDSIAPEPAQWLLQLPEAETGKALSINFREPLDYFLIRETIRITDEKGTRIKGNLNVLHKERGVEFFPEKGWQSGRYRIQVFSYLEDLAGNNLSRLFDRDIRVKASNTNKEIKETEFIIEAGKK